MSELIAGTQAPITDIIYNDVRIKGMYKGSELLWPRLDNATWTYANTSTTYEFKRIVWSPQLSLYIAHVRDSIYTSVDALTWTLAYTHSAIINDVNVRTTGAYYLYFSTGDTSFYGSTNATSWTYMGASASSYFTQVGRTTAWGDNEFYDKYILNSSDSFTFQNIGITDVISNSVFHNNIDMQLILDSTTTNSKAIYYNEYELYRWTETTYPNATFPYNYLTNGAAKSNSRVVQRNDGYLFGSVNCGNYADLRKIFYGFLGSLTITTSTLQGILPVEYAPALGKFIGLLDDMTLGSTVGYVYTSTDGLTWEYASTYTRPVSEYADFVYWDETNLSLIIHFGRYIAKARV